MISSVIQRPVPTGVGTGLDHLAEGRVDPHLEAPQRLLQRSAGVHPAGQQHPARVRRPPAERPGAELAQPHREDTAAVGLDEGPGAQVAADGDHVLAVVHLAEVEDPGGRAGARPARSSPGHRSATVATQAMWGSMASADSWP